MASTRTLSSTDTPPAAFHLLIGCVSAPCGDFLFTDWPIHMPLRLMHDDIRMTRSLPIDVIIKRSQIRSTPRGRSKLILATAVVFLRLDKFAHICREEHNEQLHRQEAGRQYATCARALLRARSREQQLTNKKYRQKTLE